MLIFTFILFICNYFYFIPYINYIFFISLKMLKKDASGVPNTFKCFIEKIKLEMLRKQRLRNVELDPTLTHFI